MIACLELFLYLCIIWFSIPVKMDLIIAKIGMVVGSTLPMAQNHNR